MTTTTVPQKLWVLLKSHDSAVVNNSIKVPTAGCEDVDDFIKAIKRELSPKLDQVAVDDITLHLTEDADALRPGLSLSNISSQPGYIANADETPLIVMIPPSAAPSLDLDNRPHIDDYVLEYLQKTFDIIKSSPTVENEVIIDFVKAGIKDYRLPYTKEYLVRNLKCSETKAEDFLLAQSAFFAVSFKPQEYKDLGPLDFTPFVVDAHTNLRTGGFGMVEKVFEGEKPLARKTINDIYNNDKIMTEIKILRLATDSGNPHLVHLRCAYQQKNNSYLVMDPWCEFDLSYFLRSAHEMLWWTERTPKDRLILITDWMACLASGLCALHKKNIKHQDLKPENVLLDANFLPVICDFGLSKAFKETSKSVKVQGTRAYFPPEQHSGKVGRKGDIFSLGLVFLELALFLFGHQPLEVEIKSGYFMDITACLEDFLADKFQSVGSAIFDDWNERFTGLLQCMLNVTPENRPKASEVWDQVRDMVETLGAKPHCEDVSSLGSIPREQDEADEDSDLNLRKNWAKHE